ncbi:MAG: ParA family protein [Phycisphaerae bacterium]|nr:ParA family protein [Phycisphaerae bacterium]
MQTIVIINQKGGVGKTTTTANLSAGLARRGKDVCMLDLDPQSHLTLHYGVTPTSTTATIFDVLSGESDIDSTLQMLTGNLSIVPATTDLASAESELASVPGRNHLLRTALDKMKTRSDFVLIDCPPSLGLLTLNSLVSADEVIIPLQPHFLALQGLGKLLKTIELVQQRLNPSLKVSGVLLCMYESVTRLGRDVVADVKQFFEAARGSTKPWADAKIFETVIRRNIKLAECPSFGKTIFEYEPRSHGAQDYSDLADEFLARYAQLQQQAQAASEMEAAPSVAVDSIAANPAPVAPPIAAQIPTDQPLAAPVPVTPLPTDQPAASTSADRPMMP